MVGDHHVEVSNHAVERWAEYRPHAKESVEEAFAHAKWVFRGTLNKHDEADYYLHEDLIFVCDPKKMAIITLIPVNFGFPAHVNRSVARQLAAALTLYRHNLERWRTSKQKRRSELAAAIAQQKAHAAAVEAQLRGIWEDIHGLEAEVEKLRQTEAEKEEEITKIAAALAYSIGIRQQIHAFLPQ